MFPGHRQHKTIFLMEMFSPSFSSFHIFIFTYSHLGDELYMCCCGGKITEPLNRLIAMRFQGFVLGCSAARLRAAGDGKRAAGFTRGKGRQGVMGIPCENNGSGL